MGRTALVVVALVVLASATTMGLVADAQAARASDRAACQTGGNHVAVVVDFGDGVNQQCAAFAAGATGMDALGSRVRIGDSGLVCAIDGFPNDTDCGKRTDDGHYAYWAYFRGTVAGGWSYQSVGPKDVRVKSTIVEGWRWESAGTANPDDPPPRVSADPAATCPPESTTSSEPTPTSATTAVTDTTAPSPTASAASSSATSVAAESTSSSPSSSSSSSSGSTARSSSSSSGPAASATVHDGGGGGAGSPVGVIVGVGLLGTIGAGALVLGRRRAVDGS